MNSAALNMAYKYLKTSLPVLVGLYSEVEFLDHVIIIFLIFLRNLYPISLVVAPLPVIPTVHIGSDFSSTLPTQCFLFF